MECGANKMENKYKSKEVVLMTYFCVHCWITVVLVCDGLRLGLPPARKICNRPLFGNQM